MIKLLPDLEALSQLIASGWTAKLHDSTFVTIATERCVEVASNVMFFPFIDNVGGSFDSESEHDNIKNAINKINIDFGCIFI
jgi:hypothetical protein